LRRNYTTVDSHVQRVLKDVNGRDTAITCNIDTKTPVCGCLTVGTRSRGDSNTRGYDALTVMHICSCHTFGN